MKMQIVKDGSIQGWFVSFMITLITLAAFVASMIFDKVCDRFAKIGTAWATIVIGQFTAWLAFRAYSGKTESAERKDIRIGPQGEKNGT
jgi:hypothetical protein